MNKQQIINHIACKLDSLINSAQPTDAPIQIALLATLLRDITRDDDYSYSSHSPNNIYSGASSTTLTQDALRGGINALSDNSSPSVAYTG